MTAVLGQRRGAAELRYALEETHAGASRQDAAAVREVADEALGLRHVGHHVLELGRAGRTRGRHALDVGARKAGDHEIEPRAHSAAGLSDTTMLSGRRAAGRREAASQHVLEVQERVPAPGEHADDRGIGEARQLHLHRHAALGERALDSPELARVEGPAKPIPATLLSGEPGP